ncbi:type VII secretion integral membrane protein EccD [Gordonia sp. DT30]|uniref:type VII secretion integral membrane protein EccD n=1 Tax=unclassified Gordonia (in: high G+C Gram-positive bacteria) TaxID=2657482 RepID=UPI003CF800C9
MSVFGGRTQLDIELPVDVPVVNIVPELAALIASRDVRREDEPNGIPNKRDRWVLTRLANGREVRGDQTLAMAGSHDGDLLSLRAERALKPPELFDDVVDAVARLNREGYPAWGPRAARVMAFVGLALTVAVCDVLLFGDFGLAQRTALAYQTSGVVVALVVAAVVARRYYAEQPIAAALGWAALPLIFGVASVGVGHLPAGMSAWEPAIVCGVMIISAMGGGMVIRAGHIGYVSVAVGFALCAVVAVAHAAFHWTDQVSGTVLATCGLLFAVGADPLLASLRRRRPPVAPPTSPADPNAGTSELFTNPFDRAEPSERQRRVAAGARAQVPTAEAVAESVERARATRSAFYVGAVATAITGTAIAAFAADSTPWAVIVFNTLVAAAVMLRSARKLPFLPSALLLFGGVAILVITALSLRTAPSLMYAVSALCLLALVVAGVVFGVFATDRQSPRWARLADHLDYIALAAVLPALAWAIGLYAMVVGG